MKRIIHTTVAALALTLASYAAAADEINRQDAAGLMPSGHISAGNLSTLDEVTAALKARVEQAGASTSVSLRLTVKVNFTEPPLSTAKVRIQCPSYITGKCGVYLRQNTSPDGYLNSATRISGFQLCRPGKRDWYQKSQYPPPFSRENRSGFGLLRIQNRGV